MLSKNVKYVGVNDHDIDLFEGQYIVPNGMSYNSYIILDEKIAVFDTVDAKFKEKWLSNIENTLGTRTPDYLIVQHMEPDHSANIKVFAEKFPEAKIVATDKAFAMMERFFEDSFENRRIVVKEGDSLPLGSHTLRFYTAPMVHWPEVTFVYEEEEKILFSADGFGKFGALDADEDWACEARRYYFGIVGKFGAQVQAVLKKLAGAEINAICPLHGPILTENLSYYLGLYNIWSSYEAESEGVLIAYTSVYGNTKKAALLLDEELKARKIKSVLCDLARSDMAEAVEDAFRYDRLVLATTTYNGELFPFMRIFINELLERGYKKRKIGIIENGSWAPTAARVIKKTFENSKEITFIAPVVTIHSAVKDVNKEEIKSLAENLK